MTPRVAPQPAGAETAAGADSDAAAQSPAGPPAAPAAPPSSPAGPDAGHANGAGPAATSNGRRPGVVAAGQMPPAGPRSAPSPSRRLAAALPLLASGPARDLGAIACSAVVTLVFFWPNIAQRLVAYENDTRVFYFPLFAHLSQTLRSGAFPLWSPQLFSGYPIFADGEGGALYPFHLLALLLLPLESAFTWLRPMRFFQAAIFTYLFCRTLGMGRLGALVGGIAFAFGGFSIAQIHHTNISTAAVWLPLILAFAELALRSSGRARYLFVVLAGVAFGLQGLIVHVQIVLMSVLTFGAYCGFRCIVGPVGIGPGPYAYLLRRSGWPYPRTAAVLGRPLLAAGVVSLAGLAGVALAAVQLLPLYELGTFSFRGGGVNYAFASQYSLPPAQLIALLLPEFFVADGRYWGLWSRWEVFVYAGIAPGLLAMVGLVLGRRWPVLFFAVVGAGALVMATGEYSPFGLHRTLSALPGFSVLRAPGRFSYLFQLSVAVLAAYGMDTLRRELRAPASGSRPAGPAVRAAVLGSVVLLFQMLAIAAPIVLVLASTFVETQKDVVMVWLQDTFVRMRGYDPRWTPEHLYQALAASLDVTQPSTIRQLALLLATTAVVTLWDRLRALAPVWQALLVVLVAVDLIALGRGFHPTAPYEQFATPSGVARFVAGTPGLFRVFSQKGSRDEPNRLLEHNVAEANGYSSLEPDRHMHYAAMAEYAPNRLLDIINARYYAVKNVFEGQPSFNLTSYNPRRPLLSSTGRNPASRGTYRLDNVPADTVRVVSTMRWASSVPQGTEVAELSAVDSAGKEYRFKLLAGVHTAEWAWERPDVRAKIAHELPPVAYTWQQRDGRAQPYPGHFYYAQFPLGASTTLRRLEVRFLHPTAEVEIYGLAVLDDRTKDVEQLDLNKNQKFGKVYSDADVILYENQTWLPRAYLVPSAIVEKPGPEVLTRMAQGDFSPERFVILEEQFDVGLLPPPAPADQPVAPITFNRPLGTEITSGPGTVRITRADAEQLHLDVSARQNAMLFLADLAYPGWTAYVDGRETRIYRANYIFRAVFVPAGAHKVEFVYRPRSFRLGLLITLASTGGLIAAIALLAAGRRAQVRWPPRWVSHPWQHHRDSAKMAVPGLLPPSAAAVAAERGITQTKGRHSDGRQESEGDGQEEPAERGEEDGEEKVATPSTR